MKWFCLQRSALWGLSRACFRCITVLGIATYLATFVSAIQSGFRNYFNFKGRASRSEFWWWFLFALIHQLPTLVIYSDYFNFAGLGYYLRLVVLVPTIAVAVRRMHDTNHRGWCLLVPPVNLVLAFQKGDEKQNRFGLSPKPLRSKDSSP